MLKNKNNLQSQMLEMLHDLVNIDSGTDDKKGVDKVGNYLSELYENLGFEITKYQNQDLGDNIVLHHKDAKSPSILILAHMDTVFPKGTVEKRPFTIENEKAYGPGVIDMKASHVMLYYSILALIEQNNDTYTDLEIVLNSDEEIGSRTSRALIEEKAKAKKFALVLEPARTDGSIVSARRGTGRYTLHIHGKAAHAGIEPENGKSAIEVLAHKTLKLHALTNSKENINVNVGLVNGGTTANTIAESATAEIDVRISHYEQAEWIDRRIHEICSETEIDGVTTSLVGGINRLPMVATDTSKQLVDLILDEGKKLGIAIDHVATGGASDASLTSSVGIPTVDGLGPVGGLQHSENEYLEINSLVERTQLFTQVLARLKTLNAK